MAGTGATGWPYLQHSGGPAGFVRLLIDLPGYRGRVERGLRIRLAGFDWNCTQQITPRYTEAQVSQVVEGLTARIADLQARLAAMQPGAGKRTPAT